MRNDFQMKILPLFFLSWLCVPSFVYADDIASLRQALSFHASFDKGFDADFSKGGTACMNRENKALVPASFNEDVKHAPGAGKFGAALHFVRKNAMRPQFGGAGVLNYNDRDWTGSVSVWLKLDPDKDLEPGYCDPVQIVGDDTKKGYIFMEWSKDETPRLFRYAIRPLFHIWNPNGLQWADIPVEKRPMVQVAKPVFSREKWTQTVFTFESINHKTAKPSGKLYVDGELQGRIENWDLTFGWDASQVALVLGAAYVGYMDDLCVFNKALTDGEARTLFQLKNGGADLR